MLLKLSVASRVRLETINKYSRESREVLALTRLENKMMPTAAERLISHPDAAIEWIKRANTHFLQAALRGWFAENEYRWCLPAHCMPKHVIVSTRKQAASTHA